MLELLLKLIDRLIELKKYRAERLEKTCHDILDPAFADLSQIHGDYLNMFEQVREELDAIGAPSSSEGRRHLLEIAERLRRRRLEFEPVRQKLSALCVELGTTLYERKVSLGSDQIDQFIAAVIRYFPTARIVATKSRATTLLAAIQGAAAVTPEQIDRDGKSLPELVQSTIDDCRDRWQDVCNSHAKLTLAIKTAR